MSTRLSVLMLLACLPLAAGASETTATEDAATPATAAVTKKPAVCEKVTGSRVRPSARDCASTIPFTIFSRRPSAHRAMNMADALRKRTDFANPPVQ